MGDQPKPFRPDSTLRISAAQARSVDIGGDPMVGLAYRGTPLARAILSSLPEDHRTDGSTLLVFEI